MNPVIVLDEVDKLGSDFRGDPSSALLEVLDPRRTTPSATTIWKSTRLSRVMFVATANVIDTIPSALLDRMEIIRLTATPSPKRSPSLATTCSVDNSHARTA